MYISETSPRSVVEAYRLQFEKDFNLFLQLRSEEVPVGGLMVLMLRARQSREPQEGSFFWDQLAHALAILFDSVRTI